MTKMTKKELVYLLDTSRETLNRFLDFCLSFDKNQVSIDNSVYPAIVEFENLKTLKKQFQLWLKANKDLQVKRAWISRRKKLV
jgi:hypothetical protein